MERFVDRHGGDAAGMERPQKRQRQRQRRGRPSCPRDDLGPAPQCPTPRPPMPYPWVAPKLVRIGGHTLHEATLRPDCSPGQLLLRIEPCAFACRGHWFDVTIWRRGVGTVAPATLALRGESQGRLAVWCETRTGSRVYLMAHDVIAYTYRLPKSWTLRPWDNAAVVHHKSRDTPAHLRHYDSRLHCMDVMRRVDHDALHGLEGSRAR